MYNSLVKSKYAIYYYYGDDIVMRDYSHRKKSREEIKHVIYQNHKSIYDIICEKSHYTLEKWREHIINHLFCKKLETGDFVVDIHNMFDYIMILIRKELCIINSLNYRNYSSYLDDCYTTDFELTNYSNLIRDHFIEKVLKRLEQNPKSLLELCIQAVPITHKHLLNQNPYIPRKK